MTIPQKGRQFRRDICDFYKVNEVQLPSSTPRNCSENFFRLNGNLIYEHCLPRILVFLAEYLHLKLSLSFLQIPKSNNSKNISSGQFSKLPHVQIHNFLNWKPIKDKLAEYELNLILTL